MNNIYISLVFLLFYSTCDAQFEATADSTELDNAKILIKNKCYSVANLKTGDPTLEGIKSLKEQLHKYDGANNDITSFCEGLALDKSEKSKGKYQSLQKNSIALRKIKRSILEACVPEGKTETEKEKYRILMLVKFPNEVDTLVRNLLLNNPVLFRCRKKSSMYLEGHILLTVFDKRLYKLADYIFEGTEVNFETLKKALTTEDILELKSIFHEQFRLDMHLTRPQITEYYNKFFIGKS